MSGYIYLIHLREFINSNEDIYKIGKTQNVCCRKINSRFCGYSKDSCIKIIMHVLNANEVELKLINIFDELFEKQPSLGNEYYKGDCNKMILEICKNTNQNIQDNTDQKIEQSDIEIKRLFSNIYNELSNKLYNIYSIKNIYDMYKVSDLLNNYDPKIDKKIIVDIDKFVSELKKLFETPSKSKIVTSEQYYNFCSIINTLSRHTSQILLYEQKRINMHNKDNYIILKLTKPISLIIIDVYKKKLTKCIDYNINNFNNFPF